MSSEFIDVNVKEFIAVTDYVANGSFSSLKKNVNYTEDDGYAILIRLVDYNNGWNGDYRFVDKDSYEFLDKSSVVPGDVIISNVGANAGTVFKVPDLGKPMTLGPNSVLLKPREDTKEIKDYLYYFFSSPVGQHLLNSITAGSAQPKFNKTDLRSRDIPIPVDKDYERIISPMISLDQKIHLNQQTNETLEAMAQVIFKSWFVDFDPVHAKRGANSAGYDPNRAAMAAIAGVSLDQGWDEIEAALQQKLDRMSDEQHTQLGQTAELFPDELVESEIGEVPKGWELLTLEDYITLSYGKGLRKKDRKKGNVPVYGSGGLTGSHDESLIEGPGIIVGRKGTVGSIYWEDRDFWPIDTVFYVEPKNEIDLSFYYYLLNTLGLEEMNTDAAVPGLNRNNAYRLRIPSFPVEIMTLFAAFTSDIHGMIYSKKQETKTLENLRDTLLPKLISGEVGV